MKKYLVEVKETYARTYAVDANSKDEAETIVNLFSDGCNVFEDYRDTEYSTREAEKSDDLNLYDICENPKTTTEKTKEASAKAEKRKIKEDIKIGSRVKIKENCFAKEFEPWSLRERTGIVVDGVGDNYALVLFPGWKDGHNGNPESEKSFGNKDNTCWYLPLKNLELVHDGFEVGDTVEDRPTEGDAAYKLIFSKVGRIVDFSILNGLPLVEFPKSVSGYCDYRYCQYENLTPIDA